MHFAKAMLNVFTSKGCGCRAVNPGAAASKGKSCSVDTDPVSTFWREYSRMLTRGDMNKTALCAVDSYDPYLMMNKSRLPSLERASPLRASIEQELCRASPVRSPAPYPNQTNTFGVRGALVSPADVIFDSRPPLGVNHSSRGKKKSNAAEVHAQTAIAVGSYDHVGLPRTLCECATGDKLSPHGLR